MITDLVGFTTQAQQDEAEALRLLEEHREVVRGVLGRYGGREVKTLGDGFLIEFADALAATEGGIELLRRFDERNRLRAGRRIDLRVGIHLGEVTTEGTDILGDAVNVASRLEPLAEPGGLVISGPVYEQVRGRLSVPTQALGAPPLKHVLVPIALYRVELPWKAPPVPARVAWVGREKELTDLGQAGARAVRGEGGAVVLLGDSGTGKTRLIEEFVRSTAGGALRVLRGQALRGELSLPYAPWTEAIRSFVRHAEPTELARACGNSVTEVARLVPEILERLGLPAPAVPSEPELAEERLMEGIVRFFSNLAGISPVLVVLDDLQWFDAYSQRLLRRAVREAPHAPWLIVAAARPDDPSEAAGASELWADLGRNAGCAVLPIAGLEPAAFDRFVYGLLPPPGLVPALRQRIRALCNGNPLFAEELVRRQVESGAFQRTDEGWALAPGSELKAPGTVQQLLRDRLQRLDAATLQVLRAASVAGTSIDYSLLQSVSGVPAELLVISIERAIQARVLEERVRGSGEIELAFRDVLTRDLLYEQLSLVRAGAYHRKVGEGLESVPERERREQAAAIAEHFRRGQVPAKAIDYSLVAAGRAVEVYAHPEAERHYRTALELIEATDRADPRRAETVRALAKELELLGRTSEAIEQYAVCAGLWESARDLRRASSIHSWMAMLLNDVPGREPEVVGHSEKAVDLLQAEGDSAELAQAYYSLAAETLRGGANVPHAQDLFRQSVDLAVRFGDTRTEAFGTYFLAFAMPLGRKREAIDLGSRLAAKLEAADDPTLPAILYNVGANLYFGGRGDVSTARQYLQRAREAARRQGARRHDVAIALGLADLDLFTGAWNSAEAVARRVLAQASSEDLLEQVEASFLLIRLAAARGRVDEGARLLAGLETPRLRTLLASPEGTLPFALIRTAFQLEAGRPDLAWEAVAPALQEGLTRSPTFASALAWTQALYLGVVVAAESKRPEAGDRWLSALADVAGQLDEPWARAWHLRGDGIQAQKRGSLDQAALSFQRSLAEWETMGWPFETGKTLLLLGQSERGLHRADDADDHLGRATSIFAELGAEPYLHGARREGPVYGQPRPEFKKPS